MHSFPPSNPPTETGSRSSPQHRPTATFNPRAACTASFSHVARPAFGETAAGGRRRCGSARGHRRRDRRRLRRLQRRLESAVSGNAVGGASPCGPSVSGTQLIPVGAAEGQWSDPTAGPIWVFALSTGTNISRDGDGLDGQRRYLHRTLIAVDPSYTGSVAIAGSRIGMDGPRTALRFTNGTAPCNILAPRGALGHRLTRSRPSRSRLERVGAQVGQRLRLDVRAASPSMRVGTA